MDRLNNYDKESILFEENIFDCMQTHTYECRNTKLCHDIDESDFIFGKSIDDIDFPLLQSIDARSA